MIEKREEISAHKYLGGFIWVKRHKFDSVQIAHTEQADHNRNQQPVQPAGHHRIANQFTKVFVHYGYYWLQ